MKTKAIILLLLAAVLLHPALAQTTDKEWQAKAVSKYPALGVQGSKLNKRFIDAYTQRRKTEPSFFSNPRWPLTLADELAATPQPVSPAAPSALPPQPPATATPKPETRNSSVPAVITTPVPSGIVRTTHRPIPQATKPSESEFPTGVVVIGVGAIGVVGLIIWVSAANAAQRRKHRERLFAEAREYVELAQRSHGLPTVPAHVMLKSGETAFYSAPSALYETRAVRHYQSGHAGFRVAKSVYLGGSRGRSISNQEWSKIDSGTLTITNKRLIFDGGSADRSVALPKILSADSSIDGVDVSVENRQKSMVFAAANPLILSTIIRICCQAPDPLDLSDTPLQITFDE